MLPVATKERDNDFRLGIKLRIFSYNLKQALDATGKTRAQIASDLGIGLHSLYNFLAFKGYPREEMKLKIALYLGVPVDSIFPEEIAGVRLERQPKPLSLSRTEAVALGLVGDSPRPELVADAAALRQTLMEVLTTLSPLQRRVLMLRYGLEDGRSRTLEEVGRSFSLTRERIRQIEAKALRKLRHPIRSKRLQDFLLEDWREWEGLREGQSEAVEEE